MDVPSRLRAWVVSSNRYVAAIGLSLRRKIHQPVQYHRIVPYDAILGGGESYSVCIYVWIELMWFVAEDVLADLGVRQAMRGMPKGAKL